MNKTELIDAVAEAADLTKAESSRAVDAVIASVTKALKGGDAVTPQTPVKQQDEPC